MACCAKRKAVLILGVLLVRGIYAQTEVCGTIESNTTWSSQIRLKCQVFVQPGATLTIDAGVTIEAEKANQSNVPALIVLPGARIEAKGDAARPITFTSVAAADELPDVGLWGGLIVMGNAPVYGGTQEVEGIDGYIYGGTNATDSSGILRYVRVWHGGSVTARNNEINGITLAGVGSGTIVEHCEVAFNLDDGFELFGGTVNLKYISSIFNGDDALDFDLGYQGKIQFVFVMTGENGNGVLEADSAGGDRTPRSFPQLYSATLCHYSRGSREPNKSPSIKFRDGIGGEFGNIVLMHPRNVAMQTTDCGSETHTHELPASSLRPDYLFFSSENIVFGPDDIELYEHKNGECEGLSDAIRLDPLLALMPANADAETAINPCLGANSPAFDNVDRVPDDGFYENTPYKGAFDKCGEVALWIQPFSWTAENNKLPTPKPTEQAMVPPTSNPTKPPTKPGTEPPTTEPPTEPSTKPSTYPAVAPDLKSPALSESGSTNSARSGNNNTLYIVCAVGAPFLIRAVEKFIRRCIRRWENPDPPPVPPPPAPPAPVQNHYTSFNFHAGNYHNNNN